MCSWRELRDGSLTLSDLIDMHRSLNLKGHLEAEQTKLENPQK